MIRRLASVVVSATLLAVSPARGFAQQMVNLLNYESAVPSAWKSKTPTSSLRLAEFVAPSPNGSADVVVYFFGPGPSNIEANLERWKAQFSNPEGKPVYESVSSDSSGRNRLTIAEYRGTYARGIGAGSIADAARPNNTLVAVVAETERGTLFFQLFGENKAVDAARDAFMTFVRGLK